MQRYRHGFERLGVSHSRYFYGPIGAAIVWDEGSSATDFCNGSEVVVREASQVQLRQRTCETLRASSP
jgi:hypothetical protein